MDTNLSRQLSGLIVNPGLANNVTQAWKSASRKSSERKVSSAEGRAFRSVRSAKGQAFRGVSSAEDRGLEEVLGMLSLQRVLQHVLY
jgi:hypothetical protein